MQGPGEWLACRPPQHIRGCCKPATEGAYAVAAASPGPPADSIFRRPQRRWRWVRCHVSSRYGIGRGSLCEQARTSVRADQHGAEWEEVHGPAAQLDFRLFFRPQGEALGRVVGRALGFQGLRGARLAARKAFGFEAKASGRRLSPYMEILSEPAMPCASMHFRMKTSFWAALVSVLEGHCSGGLGCRFIRGPNFGFDFCCSWAMAGFGCLCG